MVWLSATLAFSSEGISQKATDTEHIGNQQSSLHRSLTSLRTTLTFDNAPLENILAHLSTTTGAVILPGSTPLGITLSVRSSGKVLLSEAVEALNVALEPHKFAVLVSDRFVTLVSTSELATADLPVRREHDPERIDKGRTPCILVTPTPYLDPRELVRNLTPLLPGGALLIASEDAQALVMVGAASDVKRILTIVRALDHSEASLNELAVTPLTFSDAVTLARTATELFATSDRTQTNTVPTQANPASAVQRGKGFLAVGDAHSNSVIMRGAPAQIAAATGLIRQLDHQITEDTYIRIIGLRNADATETAAVVNSLFPSQAEPSRSVSNETIPLAEAAPGGEKTPGERALRATEVIAVADARSNALVVRAGQSRMDSIVRIVSEIDNSDAKRRRVYIFQLNSDPAAVARVLQDTFSSPSSLTTTIAQSPLESRRQQRSAIGGNR